MEVDHGGVDIGVAEQVLDRADVGAGFEKMGRERVAHRVSCGALRDAGFADRFAKLAGHGIIVQVITCEVTGPRVRAKRRRGEEPLPCPLAAGIGVFPPEGFRNVDVAGTTGKILKVLVTGFCQVLLEAGFQSSREGDDTVPTAFAVVDRDGSLSEIQILDAQAHGLREPQAAAIHDLGGEAIGIGEMGEYRGYFFTSQDYRGPPWSGGGDRRFDGEIGDSENLAVEENHGIQRLLLGGWGDLTFEGEIVQVSRDGRCSSELW